SVLTVCPQICHNLRNVGPAGEDSPADATTHGLGKLMATDTARSTVSPAGRHLWQVPALLLGVVALVGVLVARSHLSKDTAAGAEHLLRDARKALEQSPPDLPTTIQKAGQALALADRYPQFAAEAQFLAGSAHL